MPEEARVVTGGVDAHADFHVAAAVDEVGRVLGSEKFPATTAGYSALLEWLISHGRLANVGVEGTGSYGAGLARYLATRPVGVVEVIRPNRQARRRGKSDVTDAIAAALAALSGDASGVPRSHDGSVESVRALRVACRRCQRRAPRRPTSYATSSSPPPSRCMHSSPAWPGRLRPRRPLASALACCQSHWKGPRQPWHQ